MRRRVDLDQTLPPVAIPGRIYNELCAHAREAWPEECCGLIVGTEENPFGSVVRCRNEMTKRHHEDPERFPRDNLSGFWMSEADYLRAASEAEAAGREVTAVYHSHVDLDAYLSETDLEFAEPGVFPRAQQLVIAVSGGRVQRIGLFRREGVGQPFVGRVAEGSAP